MSRLLGSDRRIYKTDTPAYRETQVVPRYAAAKPTAHIHQPRASSASERSGAPWS